jgi:hypothetical protein
LIKAKFQHLKYGGKTVDFRGKMGKMTRFPLILLDAPNASTEVPLLATFEGTAQDRDFLQVKKSDELSWIIK